MEAASTLRSLCVSIFSFSCLVICVLALTDVLMSAEGSTHSLVSSQLPPWYETSAAILTVLRSFHFSLCLPHFAVPIDFFFSCTSKTDQLMVFMIVMQEMDVQSPKRALISAAFTFKQLILNYFLCFFTLNYVQKVLKFVQTFLLSRSLTKEIVEMLTGKLFVNSLTGQ